MRYLVDLQHPAHLHFFRNAADRLSHEGHEILFTGRRKDILLELAREYGIDIRVLSNSRKGLMGMGLEVAQHQARIVSLIRSFKPHALLAIAGTFIGIPGFMSRTPTYIFYDTEHATVSNMLAYPFATCVYVPGCYRKKIRWRHERYDGYHELAYLHPKYFSPDRNAIAEAGLNPDERFVLMRFVSWGAAHDIGLSGFALENKLLAVNEFSKHCRVLISCEGEIPEELEPYRLKLRFSRIHHLMAFADIIFGESATMCSEGAMLGVPGIYLDPVGRGYTDEQEKEYGLVFNFVPQHQESAIKKGMDILSSFERRTWQEKSNRLISKKIDVTDLICHVATELPYAKKRNFQD